MSQSGDHFHGRVDIGERALHVTVAGSGSPAIVVEVGSTMPGSTGDPGWADLRQQLARETRVVFYDRANLGASDPAPLPRTLNDFSDDLHAVLQAAQVEPPYLLVGGSFGGMLVVHYASRYPDRVCGLVLLDSTHPEADLRTLALLPPETHDEPPSLAAFRRLAWQEYYAPLETFEWEGLDAPASIRQAQQTWNLGDIPLVILTAGINEWEPDFPPEIYTAYEALWMELQHAYAALSTRATHIVIEDSDHIVHACRPDLVLWSIHHILAQQGFPPLNGGKPDQK